MTEEELKNKCTERARIFQQAMESCHSSNPIDCIEWFADRIAELEKENAELKEDNSEWEKASDKWKSVYELTNNQLSKAKEIIKEFMKYEINEYDGSLEIHFEELKKQAEQFLNNEVKK